MAAVNDIKDIDTALPENNTSVMGVGCAQNSTNIAQLDDIIRRVLSVMAKGDYGTLPIKADTISESTAAAGVTIDGALIKDGDLPNLGGTAVNDFVRMAAGPKLPAVDGSDLTSLGALVAIQTFTASGTWTKTAGVTRVLVKRQNPGAGGGGSSTTDNRIGQGGGAGAYAENLLDVTSIPSATITIGTAGAAGTGTGSGSNGGIITWVDGTNFLTSTAATGGLPGNTAGASAAAGGTVADGDLNIPGGRGSSGGVDSASANGRGGDSHLGTGAPHVARESASLAPEGYGGGGAGGHGGASAIAGGAGAPGIVIVYEYK